MRKWCHAPSGLKTGFLNYKTLTTVDYQCIPLQRKRPRPEFYLPNNEMKCGWWLVQAATSFHTACTVYWLRICFLSEFWVKNGEPSSAFFPKLILWPPSLMGISRMQIYAYIASTYRACQQQWKLSKVGDVFYWNNNTLIYIYIFFQMFFLDKTLPNLIVGIDALDRLQQM